MSTLEHVGLDNTLLYTSDGSKKETEKSGMLIFVRELRRVLRSGGKLYLTVPFGSHQNFGWFQVFNAEMVELLASEFQPAHRIDNYFKYTSRGWAVSRPEELCDTDYFDVQTSSTRTAPDGAAGARGLICLEWTT